ncbi:hypothetical protein GW765_01895 [Candidatus Parcubacteria bacterium]|nr:hypothetical protein [Candidatus Parcubacteria bacterium]
MKNILNLSNRSKKILISILAISFVTIPFVSNATTLADGMDAAYVIGAGSATQDFTINATGTTASTFQYPSAIEFDSVNNRLFVGDQLNYRVLVFNTDSDGVPIDYTADYVLGQTDFESSGSATTQSTFTNYIIGIEYDEDRNLLFTGEAARVLVFDLSGGITNGMSASYVLGQADFLSANNTTTQNGFLTQGGSLGLDDSNDILYYKDQGRVLVFDVRDSGSSDSVLCGETTNGLSDGMNASCVIGQNDFTSLVSTTTRSGMATTTDGAYINYDGDNGYLYVADTANNRGLVYDTNSLSNGMLASYVLGQDDFVSTTTEADLVATENKFVSYLSLAAPRAFDYDPVNQHLFVSDRTGSRIMIFDISSGITNGMAASLVLGQPSLTSIANHGAISGVNQSNFSGVVYDFEYVSSTKKLYVSDWGAHRVVIYDLTPTPPTSSGFSYTQPPLCKANIKPSTIKKGEEVTLSWSTSFPGKQSNYYMKVPKNGIFSPRVSSIKINPEYTTNYNLAAINMWGATFCNTTVTVLDEEGEEIINTNKNLSHLTASAVTSSFFRPIISFFMSMFVR